MSVHPTKSSVSSTGPTKCKLGFQQTKLLMDTMNEEFQIYPEHLGTAPILSVNLRDFVTEISERLKEAQTSIRDIRVNGGLASSIIGMGGPPEKNDYNDVDLIIGVELTDSAVVQQIKSVVISSLRKCVPDALVCEQSDVVFAETYLKKMVCVSSPGQDSWSLISVGHDHHPNAKSIELKFVDRMRRQFEFTVDSFQIILDSLLTFYNVCGDQDITPNFYPTVVAETVSGSFAEALEHLNCKIIVTHNPEEIRGGGLFKYCKLIVDGYTPSADTVNTLQRYMCSRFFIDFPEVKVQMEKLAKYLHEHFRETDFDQKIHCLSVLYNVIEQSTVCLMPFERSVTLQSIANMMTFFRNAMEAHYSMHQPQLQLHQPPLQQQQLQQGIPFEVVESPSWEITQVYYDSSASSMDDIDSLSSRGVPSSVMSPCPSSTTESYTDTDYDGWPAMVPYVFSQ